MFRSVVMTGFMLASSLLSMQSFAGVWISANVAEKDSPEFSSPSAACSWYIDTKLNGDYSFSHVSSNGILPPGSFFCYGVYILRPGNTWNIANAFYKGNVQDLIGKDENFYNNDETVSEELKDIIRRSMRRFYGDQVDQWDINYKMVKVFDKWMSKVSEVCKAFDYVPRPLALPIRSATGLIRYLVKYGKKIVSEHESQANYSCMLAAAAGMKTEFWMAGNL